jgi:hypothetical protein
MPYRNKAFVSFDGDHDIHYYRLMCAWTQSDRTPFNFFDAHQLTQARDSSLVESIKRSLAERLSNAKVFILLIGEQTRYLHVFVRWEIEQAIKRNIPIIAVNLNGRRNYDSDRCPPALRDHLAVYVSFNAAIIQHALENWPAEYDRLSKEGNTGPRHYDASLYKSLGL